MAALGKKIAVLTSSQCQPAWWRWSEEKKAKMMGLDPEPTTETSDQFRLLVIQGYRVMVVSTREQVGGPLDAAWMKSVRPDDIFLPDMSKSCGEQHHFANCACFLANWKRAYAHLGEPWHDNIGDWQEAQLVLGRRGYVT
jgi:hypothetical protein